MILKDSLLYSSNKEVQNRPKHNLRAFYQWNDVQFFSREDTTFLLYLREIKISIIKAQPQVEKIESHFESISIPKKG